MVHVVHATHPDIVKRLKRAEGHLRKVVAMLQDGRSCVELAQQLHAIEKAVCAAKKTLIHDHIDHCLEHATQDEPMDAQRAIEEFKEISKYSKAAMTPLADLIQQGAAHAWLFIPSALLLGALHGLEPGHSKTMMAAFIVAIRGTVWQAVLLGLSATASHTAVVWAIAMAGLYFGRRINLEASEPYFQLASALLIVVVALWMVWRTWREQTASVRAAHGHSHYHGHDEIRRIDTGHGMAELSIFEQGQSPRFRIALETGQALEPAEVSVVTTRPDATVQTFGFTKRDGYLESTDDIPEPHDFGARLALSRGLQAQDFHVEFAEHRHHDHGGLDLASPEFQDAHERAHADDIRKRFTNREVTTGQIVVFGLTGGLIPCPAAITVLLLCLQLKQFTLGIVLVLCFSVGLAATMVTVGVAAALGMRHAEKRWSDGFATFARRAPYASAAVILIVGAALAYQGLRGIAG